jgi:nitroimidazol reductase NimA-like FMN-containing flavoprotein (pyridoxamine 5'-phosphate oxidase superfamily)
MNRDFDIDCFLQKPLFAHLATMSDAGPRNSPVWFLWEAGALWIVGTSRDSFPKRIRREPRCAVGIVEFDLSRGLLRHVGIRGTGTVEQLDRGRLHRLLSRYLGADQAAWNPRFRATVIEGLDLMIRIAPASVVVRDQSYFASIQPAQGADVGE